MLLILFENDHVKLNLETVYQKSREGDEEEEDADDDDDEDDEDDNDMEILEADLTDPEVTEAQLLKHDFFQRLIEFQRAIRTLFTLM